MTSNGVVQWMMGRPSPPISPVWMPVEVLYTCALKRSLCRPLPPIQVSQPAWTDIGYQLRSRQLPFGSDRNRFAAEFGHCSTWLLVLNVPAGALGSLAAH